MSRNVEKRGVQTARNGPSPPTLRGQGGNKHGGSPWFQGGVEPGRAPAGSDFLGSVYLTLPEAEIEFKPVEPRDPRVDLLGP